MSTGQAYVGRLVGGEMVINIEGHVDREVCDFAFDALNELLSQGEGEIIFDCSKVQNLPHWWFEDQIQQSDLTPEQLSRINVQSGSRQESLKAELV